MRIAIILKVPEDMELANEPVEVQAAVAQLLPNWPAAIMPGTRIVDAYRLTYAVVSVLSDKPLEQVLELINAFKLDWQVTAMQTFADVDENGPKVYFSVLPETLDFVIPQQDEDGNDLPVTADNLSKYQGQSNWILQDD